MHFPDLANETQVTRGNYVRAIGWLSRQHEFPTGDVSLDFASKLRALCARWSHSVEALWWSVAGGGHLCEFCSVFRAGGNLGVPAGRLLFVAPEMVAHYVDVHRYRPPESFIDAVLDCPLPGSDPYSQAVAEFRELNLASARALDPPIFTARERVSNDTDETIELVLEPWGMPLQLPPRQAYELLATSPHPGKLDIERGSAITAYAWTGATIEVYAGGKLVHSQTIAVPDAPPGISIRDFMAALGLTKT